MAVKNKNTDNNVIKAVYKKSRLTRYIEFVLGVLLVALSFNIFILPNNVVSGVSGLGVILYRIVGVEPSLVILIGSVILMILSFILLGVEKTKNSIIGSLLYPIFVKLTENVPQFIDLGTTETIVMILFGAVIFGFGLGLVFKSGFTTGGTDILNQIVSKYLKLSIGNAMFITDGLIILISLFTFGWEKFIYSIISIYIISIITDKVILGISRSKTFYIITEQEDKIKEFVLNHLSHGITVLEGQGGYTGKIKKVIMCTIPTKEYFLAKEGIQQIDPNAFFLVTDAYEVSGGE